MAEGGGEFGYGEGDNLLYHTDDRDDDDAQKAERTQPFQPGAASTPYHGGETIEMQTWQHEQTGLPETSYGGTSRKITDEEPRRRLDALRDLNTGLLDDSGITLVPPDLRQEEIERVRNFIKKRYPNAKVDNLVIRFSDKNQIVVVGPKQGETKIVLDDGSSFRKDFLKMTFVKKILGDSFEEIIDEDRDTIREQRKRLREAEIQLQQAETLSSQREEEKKELEVLRRKIEQTDAKIDDIQDEHGSNLESEAELRRLKKLKKNYENDLENKKKELDSLTKKARNIEKEQEKVDRLRASSGKRK